MLPLTSPEQMPSVPELKVTYSLQTQRSIKKLSFETVTRALQAKPKFISFVCFESKKLVFFT